MKELTLINKAIKCGKWEVKQWTKLLKDMEDRVKELSNNKLK